MFKLISAGTVGLPVDGGFAYSDGTDYFRDGWVAGNSLRKQFFKKAGETVTELKVDQFPAMHSLASAVTKKDAYLMGGDIYTDFRGCIKLSAGVSTLITSDCGLGKRVLMGSDYREDKGLCVLVGGQEPAYDADHHCGRKLYNNVVHTYDFKTYKVVAQTPFETGNLYGCIQYHKNILYKIKGGVYDDLTGQGFSYPREVWASYDDGITWKYLYRIGVKGGQYPQLTTSWDGELLFCSFGANIELTLPKENMSDIICTNNPLDKSAWQSVENPLGVNLHAHAAYSRLDGIGIWAGTKNPVPNVTNNLYKITV